MRHQVYWAAQAGSDMSPFFPFALWGDSRSHYGTDLRLPECNSEGGQMAGGSDSFRPCAFAIHLLRFACQNISLLRATKQTGFTINKSNPKIRRPMRLLYGPIFLDEGTTRTTNEFTQSLALACGITIQEAKVNTAFGSLPDSRPLSVTGIWDESLAAPYWAYSYRAEENGKAVSH